MESHGSPVSSDLLRRAADPSLASVAASDRPADLGDPPASAPALDHSRLVGTGATLTGVTLLGGGALAVAGLVDLLASGGRLALVLLVVGAVLALTHWGWVHVAQATADGRDRAAARIAEADRGRWLATVLPYQRFEVRSRVRSEDAAIVLERVRFDPVPAGAATFTFAVVTERSEVHPEDAPAAEIAERAEELRHAAARDSARARSAFGEFAESAELTQLSAEDDRDQLAARTASARALSEQINAHGRRPPLTD